MTSLRIRFRETFTAKSFGRLGEGSRTFMKSETIDALGVQNMPLGGAIVFRVEGDADSWVVPARHFEVTP